MRVLLVSGEFPPMVGGVGDYTACLARALCDLGVQVSVLTSARSRLSEGVFAFPVSAQVADWTFRCWGSVRREVALRAPDIIHIQYQAAAYGMRPAINLLPALLRVSRSNTTPYVTFHDLKVPYLFPKAGPLRRGMLMVMARWCRGVICTDEADLETVSGWGLRRPARLIPIGSNIPVVEVGRREETSDRGEKGQRGETSQRQETSRRLVSTEGGGLKIGYFGLLNSSKGIEVMLRAYRLVRQMGFDISLNMVGADLGDSDPTNAAYARRIRGLVAELDVDGAIRWTGQLSAADTSRALQGLDICVLPYLDGASFRRGTLMAALVHGLPIVTTTPSHRPGTGPCLSDGENCRLVPPGDVGALVEAIEELANSQPFRERLGSGALELSRHFTWDRIARMTVEAYESALRSAQ